MEGRQLLLRAEVLPFSLYGLGRSGDLSVIQVMRFGRSGCGAEKYPCRAHIRAGSVHGSRQEALGSQGEPVMAEQAGFWDRLQSAWSVLMGTKTEAQATKRRFSRLLVKDRGFNSVNLSRLYNVAKGAIKQHVELEQDENAEVTAVVDRLGELKLDFRVKRVKSVLLDEPYTRAPSPDLEALFEISEHIFLEDHRPSEPKLEVEMFLEDHRPSEPKLELQLDEALDSGYQ